LSKPASVITVTFLPSEFVAEVSQKDENLLESALHAGFELDHSCGGFGTCGTCRVFVEEGLEKISARNEIEKEMADDRGFLSNERLSCQIKPEASLIVRVPRKTD
jgi:2Fe-2S ferredoxin